MTELATLICTERGLAVNRTQINKEVMRILEFESDLANVRHLGFSSGFLYLSFTQTVSLPETPTGLLSVLNYCFLSSGNMRCKWLQQCSTLLLLCTPHCQATDTQEDRSNPGFLYNKMELADLNANFTIEVDSQVFNKCSSIRISTFFSLAPASFTLFFLNPSIDFQLDLFHGENNGYSQYQHPRDGENHGLCPQLFQKTEPHTGQIHKKVCF